MRSSSNQPSDARRTWRQQVCSIVTARGSGVKRHSSESTPAEILVKAQVPRADETRHKKSRARSPPIATFHRGRTGPSLGAKIGNYCRIHRDGTISNMSRRPRHPHQSSSASRPGGKSVSVSETTLRGPSQILGHWYFSSNKKEGTKEEKQKRKRNERFRSVVIIISPSRPHDVSNTKTGGNGGAAFRRRIPWAQSEPDDRGGPIDASEGGSVPAGCGGIGPFPLVRRQPMDSTTRPTENERTHELASWCWLLLVVRSCDGKKEK